MVPPQYSWFTHRGADLFYVVEGSGPAVLLIHGWTCDLHDWSLQIQHLVQLGFQTIAYDWRGHGKSSIPQDDDYTPESLADDAAALLKYLSVPEAIVFGHSAGAIVASTMAVRHPEQGKALVLIDPVYNASEKQRVESVAHFQGPDSPQAAYAFLSLFYTKETPTWMKTWHHYRMLGMPPRVVSACQRSHLEGERMSQREVAEVYFQDRKCPRLVVCGFGFIADFEKVIGLKEEDQVTLLEAGHWLHQQEADKFNLVVEEWLKATTLLPYQVEEQSSGSSQEVVVPPLQSCFEEDI